MIPFSRAAAELFSSPRRKRSSIASRAESIGRPRPRFRVGIDVRATDARAIGARVTPALFAYSAFHPHYVPYVIPSSAAASAFEISPI